MSQWQEGDGKEVGGGGTVDAGGVDGGKERERGVGGAGTRLETSKIQIKQTNRWMWHISIQQQQTVGAMLHVQEIVESWKSSRVNRAKD